MAGSPRAVHFAQELLEEMLASFELSVPDYRLLLAAQEGPPMGVDWDESPGELLLTCGLIVRAPSWELSGRWSSTEDGRRVTEILSRWLQMEFVARHLPAPNIVLDNAHELGSHRLRGRYGKNATRNRG